MSRYPGSFNPRRKLSPVFLFVLSSVLILLHSTSLLAGTTPSRGELSSKKTDSLKAEINKCHTDTCRFNVLSGFFWKYAHYDLRYVRPVGEWAIDEIRNSDDLKALSDAYDIRGFIFGADGDFDSASYYYLKSLQLSSKLKNYSRSGWTYYHLSMLHAKLGEIDSALYYMNVLTDLYKDKQLQSSVCDILKQIGYLYLEKSRKPDSAIAFFDRMLKYSREIHDQNKEMEAYLIMMNFYNETNNLPALLETINSALVLAEKTKHQKGLINIYYLIGEVFLNQKKNYDIALLYYNKVLEICKSKYRDWEATILNDIAEVYLRKENDSLAMSYANRGLKLAYELKFKHQISEAHRNIGRIYKFRGDLDRAIDNFKICYETGCDKCSKITFHNALIEIADAYLILRNQSLAYEYYMLSLNLAEQFNAPRELAISNMRLGNYFVYSNRSMAEQYYMKAMNSAKSSNDIGTIQIIADTLSSFFEIKRDFQSAYKYNVIAGTLKDSMNNIAQRANMADLELKLLYDKMNKENEAREQQAIAEIKRQKILRNAAFLILFLVITLALVIYNNYHRKRKDSLLLEKMSAELHEADKKKLRFFAGVSHELRTPLTLILNPARKLIDSMNNDLPHKKQLIHIYNNALKLHDLTNQIMDLQKLDAGKLKLTPETDDIITFCIGTISSFESLCQKKRNLIRIESNCCKVIAQFDKDKLSKIISNILSNAFKFCYQDTIIKVDITVTGGSFEVTVTDKGIGIPADEIGNTFREYYQASTNNLSQGTGLGLAYVKELTEFMGGKVDISSNVKEWTTVRFQIPLNTRSTVNLQKYSIDIPRLKPFAVTEFIPANSVKNDQNTLLIVEDNDELRNFIAELFSDDYNLVLASDGEAGINAACKYIPDIIISDVMMPVKNGLEMCSSVKKDVRTSHIPVILLTAKDSSESSIEGYQTGADDYILKPFDNETLVLKVRNIIATRQSLRTQYKADTNMLPESGGYSDIDKKFMNKCKDIIERNINNPEFSVEILARELAFSRSNLYRKIQSLTNLNPAELIRNFRMQHASRLLKTTDLKVYEVAIEVGYDNTNKFSQAFKRQFGLLPSQV